MQDIPFKGLRVLILDDEALIALDLEQFFRDRGAEDVVTAYSLDGVDAAFDLVVLDVTLGGHSTVEFASGLFARGVALVFVTGVDDAAQLLAGMPGVPVVDKLSSPEVLAEAVAAALRLRR